MHLRPVTQTKFPCWCPNCGCADRMKFPFPIGENLVGCQDCMKVWPKEALIVQLQITQPLVGELTVREGIQ